MGQRCNCNGMLGNSIDIDLANIGDCEIRADVVVRQIRAKRIWGQVIDCEGVPMPKVLVKLVRVICDGERNAYQGVAHTVTDCQGFYQFDVSADDKSYYKILVSRTIEGSEAVIPYVESRCSYNKSCESRYPKQFRDRC